MYTKLNLGCGSKLKEGDEWLNVDAVYPDPDIYNSAAYNFHKGSIFTLPIEDGSIELIELRQVFEHVTPHQSEELLKECWRVLRPDGVMYMDMPDLAVAAYALMRSLETSHVPLYFFALRSFYGSFEQACQKHQWGYTPSLLCPMLEAMGWAVTQVDMIENPRMPIGPLVEKFVASGLSREDSEIIANGRHFAVLCTKHAPDILPMPAIAYTGGIQGGLINYPSYQE